MMYKDRTKPNVLCILEALLIRADLSDEEKQYAYSQMKGYKGELHFDSIIEKYLPDYLMIPDLFLKSQGSTFQIDMSILTDQKIYIYEVKNYQGELMYREGRMTYYSSGLEILNPVSQVQRAAILLKNLFRKHNIKLEVEPYVVFINPNCTIYQSIPDKRILLPSLLDSHFKLIEKQSNIKNRKLLEIAERLSNVNLKSYLLTDLPNYNFSMLRKGIYCSECNEFLDNILGRMCVCKSCGFKESAIDNAMRHTIEYQTLFSDEPLKTEVLHAWCGGLHSMYRLRKVVKSYNEEKSGQARLSM
ncbi:nuclease-related domain-containing protein [Alkalibacterium pelagium]|uniref:Nuclease-related domain-containing protein n=1 Tax=Alkalibacterium pelagium TaxID=426702 RepID=A0A1H7HTZ8_9LACT|nr:nuclease-related domain-containing protein [Alkalibacterium pelagium]GEN50376.1 hypothetical protein APE02nite_10410 [Alkalibacterium pelagium]SEK52550.1 Nuclease-related domain-containing protein [Alkalibacterium pelagium]